MAAKYQLITELYRRTGVAVAKNPQAWQGFLSSACRNYKCRFDEQLLIYAQRPDAVAVAKLETWNRQFKRWVNKDSKGIAVFDPKGRRNTLKYYFDVSDTHEGYYGSRPVPIWQMDERYEQAVMERLSDRFGDVESTDLASALMETAKNAVEDNLQDYFSQLKDCTKDSFLEELDDFNIEVIYRRLAANSVAFMLISRCGLDTNEFFDREDFADIVNFNTPATINAIGVATSDIAEMALREISQSIRNVQMAEKDQNRTFAQRTQAQYDKGRQQPERSEYNERNHLQQTGGLSYSRPNITDRARASAWQVRFDAQGLSGEAQTSDLSQPADIGQAERASARGRADSTPEVGASDEAALSRAGRDRGTERESSDAVGRTDEQHPQPSGGSDTDRTDLQVSVAKEDEVRVNLPTVDEQIEMIAKAEDEKASAFAISKEDIDSVLQKGSGFEDSKYRIYRQFQKGENKQKNIEFLKDEYGTGGGGHTFPDGFGGHTWHNGNHFVVNSVSFVDGKHYHDNKANLRLLRQRSDELCREYALSVIEHPSGKKKPYALYQAEKQGRPTRDNVARQAVDEAIAQSYTLKDFDRIMAEMGYRVSFDPNRKYWTIIGKGWQRPKRLYKLGEDYTNDRITERISQNSYAVRFDRFTDTPKQVKVYRVKGSLSDIKKIGGLRGLYLHYCYKLGILPKNKKQNYARLHYLLKDDLMKMEAIAKETRLLCRNHIDTAQQLLSYEGSLEMEMSALLEKRKELYSKSRSAKDEDTKSQVKAELSDISKRLSILRKEVKLCEGIAARSDTLKEKLAAIRADEQEQQRKELTKNEHRRRSGRTNRPNELGGL